MVAAGEAPITCFHWLDTTGTTGQKLSVLLVGDELGGLRVCSDGTALIQQQLWDSPVLSICGCIASEPTQPDGVLVLHKDGVVSYIEGAMLFVAIQAGLMQQSAPLDSDTPLSISRWTFGTPPAAAAFCGGMKHQISNGKPAEGLTVLTVGSTPLIAQHQALKHEVKIDCSCRAL